MSKSRIDFGIFWLVMQGDIFLFDIKAEGVDIKGQYVYNGTYMQASTNQKGSLCLCRFLQSSLI